MTRSALCSAALLLTLAACGAPAQEPPRAAETKPVAPGDVVAPTPANTASPSATAGAQVATDTPTAKPLAVAGGSSTPPPAPLRDDLVALRNKGITAMDAGAYVEARDAFKAVLEAAPGDVTTLSLLNAAEKALASSQANASSDLARIQPRVLAAPPFAAFVGKGVKVSDKRASLTLVKRSEARNAITDDEQWFIKNDLHLPAYQVPSPRGNTGNLPPGLPTRYGNNILIEAIHHPDHLVLIFGPDWSGGRYVVLLDNNRRVTSVFDFEAFRRAPTVIPGDEGFVDQRVSWAEARDGVLYVSHGHRTYAKSSGGKNAFISAIDIATGEMLWESAPLVSNASTFILMGGFVICGYGFTAEPDYMFVLDQETGKTVKRTPVASGPSVLVMKDNALFVRTYDTDYVFDVK